MRRFKFLPLWIALFAMVSSVDAAEPRIVKVLTQYLDLQGRHTLSPSLFERDAYQDQLRQHPAQRSGIRFAIQWKARGMNSSHLKVRVELRGLKGNDLQTKSSEAPAGKPGWLTTWSTAELAGADYQQFGEIVAWRVALLDGEMQIAEQKSFLW